MGGLKLPDLQVLRPKGTSGAKKITAHTEEIKWKQERKGEKRIWDQTPEKTRPEKRQRETSPEPEQGSPRWMEPPTFLTDEERKAKEQSGRGEKEEPQDLSSKVWSFSEDQDPRDK